jgi:hypothetical protein
MGNRKRIGSLFCLRTNRARNRTAIRTQIRTPVRRPLMIPRSSIKHLHLCPLNIKYLDYFFHFRVAGSALEMDFFNFEWWVHVYNEFRPARELCSIKDVSYGKENVPVSCVNSLDNNYPGTRFTNLTNFLQDREREKKKKKERETEEKTERERERETESEVR